MKVSFFIDRPVFSAVISILIVIVGIIGLTMLPIDQYPQITPPVVKISASYPGASALTVSQAVATPIEQELNGTPGMLYMESNSSNSGGFSATVTFDISADPDLAAVEIQNRIKLAESRLPAEVIQNGISVEKQAASQLLTLCLTSTDPKFDEIYLSNFATLNVLDLIRRIPGVGRVSNIGSRYYAMQIWVQPDKLANFGLTVADLQNALKDQNRESAAGVLGQQPVQGLDVTIPITTQGRLSTVSQFEEIVVRANADGSIIRLRDVARISLEAQSYNTESAINKENAAVLAIYMLPGANAMEVAKSVKEAMEEISKNFPEGMSYEIPFDMTTYISESIHEVYKTLFEALILVIIVVYLSLQSWRATVIPLVAVPISLIGTFGFMLIFGFSLNILTVGIGTCHRYCGGRCYRGSRECGAYHGRGETISLPSYQESYGRTYRSHYRHFFGTGSSICSRKFSRWNYRTTLSPVYGNHRSIRIAVYGSSFDIESSHVFAYPETGRSEQEKEYRIPPYQ